MTAGRAPAPKIVLAVGVPDGVSSQEAKHRFDKGRLQGISGISRALFPWMRARGQRYAVMMFGADPDLGSEAAKRLLDESGGRVMVNLICEPLVQRSALEQLARFELATRVPLINPTWAVNATTRPLIARRLAYQARVRAPHCSFYRSGPRTLAQHVEAERHTYPVLLRPPGLHGSQGLVRVDDPDELTNKAAALRSCTVTDFVDFRSEDGLWRKYRMVYAGDRLFRRHILTDTAWNLTRDARRFSRDRADLVAEEQEWLRRPVTLEGDSIEARVMHQFRALQLDFGVIDCALTPGGDLVVFEINACVQITNSIDEHAMGDRRYFEANNEQILSALLDEIHARAAS